MQETSDLHKQIISGEYKTKCRLLIGDKNAPISELTAYEADELWSMFVSARLFANNTPEVGGCISGEIDVEMFLPSASVPRQAKLVPQVCVTSMDGSQQAEYLSKGVYFVDTRHTVGDTGRKKLVLHGYDAMLMTEQDYPSSSLAWPARDIDVVREIAAFIGVEVDSRTVAIMTKGYAVQYPGEYSCRETLGFIAAMYGGCFIMSDIGELRLVQLGSIPKAARVLGNRSGVPISFGGELIRV